MPFPDDNPRRILAIKLRELGDTVLWTPALAALKHAYPVADMDVLVLTKAAPLLEENPHVHKIHHVKSRNPQDILPVLFSLRKNRYDLALGFHANTWLCRLFPLLGAKCRVVHHHSWRKTPRASHRTVPHAGRLESSIQRDFRVLEALGISKLAEEPRLFLSAAETKEAQTRLESALPQTDSKRPRVAFLPGASSFTKIYPKGVWLQVLQSAQGAYQPVVLCDPHLSKAWELPKLLAPLGIPLFDTLNLRQLAAMLSLFDVAIGNDSGPSHIASAVGLKTITIFGPSCFGDFFPYKADRHVALRRAVSCRNKGPSTQEEFTYCTVTRCDHLTCLNSIQSSDVVRELKHLSEA